MVGKGVVLFRIQYLEHGRGRITPEIGRHLVDLIQQEQGITHPHLGQVLDDLARQGADIGAPVTTDLRLVAHATQGHARELAVGGAGDGPAQGGLAHTGWPHQAQDRALELLHPLLHREIFQDALLDLLQAIMILFQHRLGARQVVQDLGALFPGHAHQPVDVVTHHRGFRRHGGHELQLVELGHGLGLGLLAHAGLFDLFLQFLDFVGHVLHFTQLFLNGLHLLIQVVLALALLHLLLYAAANTLLDLQDIDLTLDHAHQVLQALTHILDFENALLFL